MMNLAISVLVIVGLWFVFNKAKQPGWAAIIPIYNFYVLLQVVGKPWWWLLLFLIPGVNLVFLISLSICCQKVLAREWVTL